nr:GerMN domain-containing protein [Streptomyces sp. NBC_00899]
MKARTALGPLAGLLLAGLLAGCGIPTTGVVEAGEPAAGVHQDVTLYFVRADDGSLATVHRPADTEVDAEAAVGMLFNGAGMFAEKMLGLTTDLPPTAATVRTHGGTVTVDLAAPASEVTRTAVDQIVCTVLANPDPGLPDDAGPPEVTVTAQGVTVSGRTGGDSCTTLTEPWPSKPGGGPTSPPG